MLALDHIVIAGKNAAEDSITFDDRMAIKAIKGGEHENWGTYNYLAYFSNESYIEWLGIKDYDTASKSDNPLIQHLVYMLDQNLSVPFQFALRTNQMDDYIQHFKMNDIPFDGPFPGERERPDGTMLSWRMLFPKYDIEEGMLPFLIEWANPSGGPSAQSLANPQAIMKINYSGVDKSTFTKIYQLKNKKSLSNQFILRNSRISFKDDGDLSFELV
ncbi:VOC family protein [Ornithinibacillus sp. 179-J 7C1 HS]|uniref:VOC family protein n=1 Tax=Ornithinibacillus sp. 179-J 7C1 HS TaxID=3142384 RepID=UPI0039A0D346